MFYPKIISGVDLECEVRLAESCSVAQWNQAESRRSNDDLTIDTDEHSMSSKPSNIMTASIRTLIMISERSRWLAEDPLSYI